MFSDLGPNMARPIEMLPIVSIPNLADYMFFTDPVLFNRVRLLTWHREGGFQL